MESDPIDLLTPLISIDLTLGLIGKVGGTTALNYAAGEVEKRTTGIISKAARFIGSRAATAIMAPFAVKELFEQCECKKINEHEYQNSLIYIDSCFACYL